MAKVQIFNTAFGTNSKNLRHFTLTRGPTTPMFGGDDAPVLNIMLQPREIGNGNGGHVFRGDLSGAGIPDAKNCLYKVVVKVVARCLDRDRGTTQGRNSGRGRVIRMDNIDDPIRDLEEEASVYADDLQAIQGTVVPRFYGYGVSGDGKAAVLILEDTGVPLDRDTPWDLLPVEDRLAIYHHHIALHQCGISLTHLEPQNITKSAQGIRITDFSPSRVKPHWACPIFNTETLTTPEAKSVRAAYEPHVCPSLDRWRVKLGFCALDGEEDAPGDDEAKKEQANGRQLYN